MKEYLKSNTQVREDILNQKLFFDLKEASSLRQIHLKIFRSDVDIDGFDIIIDNNEDLLLKCQVKSILDSTNESFYIHRIMLKPNYYVFAEFNFVEPIGCPSDSRGVLLIEADVIDNKIETKYFYLDIYLLRAMELGVFKFNKQSKTSAKKILTLLRDDRFRSNEKIRVPKSLFFPLKDVQSLLAIIGFHSVFNSNISNNIIEISKHDTFRTLKKYAKVTDRIPDMRGHWENINETLSNFIHPNHKLITFDLKEDYFDRPINFIS